MFVSTPTKNYERGFQKIYGNRCVCVVCGVR